MMRLLRAVGAAVTAFVDELSPYDFPLFADIPEEQPVLRWGQDSSCDVAAGADDQVPAGVDSPTAPAGLPKGLSASDIAMQMITWVTGATQPDDRRAHLLASRIAYAWIHTPTRFLSAKKLEDVIDLTEAK